MEEQVNEEDWRNNYRKKVGGTSIGRRLEIEELLKEEDWRNYIGRKLEEQVKEENRRN